MVDGMPDDEREFEQLALGATITGPGMRTEDPYEPGTRLSIKGERGTFTYRYATLSRSGQVSLHLTGDHGSRALRPDQVTPVKSTRKPKWTTDESPSGPSVD
jgi:hypothetical protein